jgi:hypothetical protein
MKSIWLSYYSQSVSKSVFSYVVQQGMNRRAPVSRYTVAIAHSDLTLTCLSVSERLAYHPKQLICSSALDHLSNIASTHRTAASESNSVKEVI